MVSSNKLYNSDTDLTTDVNSLVRKITYPVANFLVQGSVSDAIATFDPKTLEYTLSAAKEGTDVIDAPYLKGQVEAYDGNNALVDGSVFSYEGQYFLMLDSNNFDISAVENLDSINKQGGGAFLLGKELPQEGKETIFQDGRVDKISEGKVISFSMFSLTETGILYYPGHTMSHLVTFLMKIQIFKMLTSSVKFLLGLIGKGLSGLSQRLMILVKLCFTTENITNAKEMVLITKFNKLILYRRC